MKFWFFLPLIFWIGCSSAKKSTNFVETPNLATQLFSFPGSCSRGVLSPSGKRVAGICQPANKTQGHQIYEFDLNSQTYRRLSWQDGQIGSVDWLTDDSVIYDSTTDELKEAPFSGIEESKVGSEIYSSDRFGTKIDRLTERPGRDSDVSSSRNNGGLLYVTDRGTSHLVFLRQADGTLQSASPSSSNHKFAPAAHGNEIAWLETDLKTKKISLKIQGKPAPERWADRDLRALRSLPTGWLLTEVHANQSGSTAWFLSADLSCERPLWMGQEILVFADASPSTQQLLLTLETPGLSRLSLKTLDPMALACSAEQSSAKVIE